jgi:hypothetical protein
MTCFGGGPSDPKPIPQPPEEQDAAIVSSRDADRRRRRAAASQTILTSPRGVEGEATTSGKTLLGSA